MKNNTCHSVNKPFHRVSSHLTLTCHEGWERHLLNWQLTSPFSANDLPPALLSVTFWLDQGQDIKKESVHVSNPLHANIHSQTHYSWVTSLSLVMHSITSVLTGKWIISGCFSFYYSFRCQVLSGWLPITSYVVLSNFQPITILLCPCSAIHSLVK